MYAMLDASKNAEAVEIKKQFCLEVSVEGSIDGDHEIFKRRIQVLLVDKRVKKLKIGKYNMKRHGMVWDLY